MPFELVPQNTNFDFLGRRVLFNLGSVAMILVGVVATLLNGGPDLGIDFAGGTEVQLAFEQGVVVDESRLREVTHAAGFLDATVVRFGEADSSEFLIKFKAEPGSLPVEGAQPKGLEANTRVQHLETQIRESIGGFKEQRVEYVGAKVGADLRRDGITAMLLAWGAILLYVAFRFSSLYAPGAVIAIVHDVLVTAGLLVMFNIEFDLQILAAILAIIGYSLNDTIIIYDRIRENLALHSGEDLEKVLNLSVNQTLSRTLLTSGLTFLAVLSLLLLGGEVFRPFSLTMVIGIVVGSYSSIFIASPILLFLEQRFGSMKGKNSSTGRGSSGRPGGSPKRARA